MNLVKWDPIGELENASAHLIRIFGRPLARSESDNQMFAMADWAPSVDISETDSAYLFKGEIPGVKKADVKVTIGDRTKVINEPVS
jgi:HSP20 family protein